MKMYPLDGKVERIKYLREAADVNRIHTKRYIGEYTNGQHTFGMLTLLRLLWPEAPKELIWAILEHDMPERLLSDISSPAIHFGGFIDKSMLQFAEREILDEVFSEYWFTFDAPENYRWLKGLDLLELYLFCKDQRRLGNRNLVQIEHRCEEVFKYRASDFPPKIIDTFHACKADTEWLPMPDLGVDRKGERV